MYKWTIFFLTIDTTLPANNSLRFYRSIIKTRLTKAAKISTLSSKELDKYEYLTGEDLGHKPGVVEQAKFEYSPLGKVINY